jgi:hypothetical protein
LFSSLTFSASLVVRDWVKRNGAFYLRGLPPKIERLLDNHRYEKKNVTQRPSFEGVDEIY